MSSYFILALVQSNNNGNQPGNLNVLGAFNSYDEAKGQARNQAAVLLGDNAPTMNVYEISDANKAGTFTQADFKDVYQAMSDSINAQIQSLQAQAQNAQRALGTA